METQSTACSCLNTKWNIIESIHLELSTLLMNFKNYDFICFLEKTKDSQLFYIQNLLAKLQTLQNFTENAIHLFFHLDSFGFQHQPGTNGDFIVKAKDPLVVIPIALVIRHD